MTGRKIKIKEDFIVICKNCGVEVKDGVKFCPSCGYKVVPPVEAAPEAPKAGVCSGCGAELKPGVKFCPKCGKKTDENAAASVPAPAPVPVPVPAPVPAPSAKPEEKAEPEAKQEPAEEKKPEPAAQEETITCSCGNQLKPGAKFCPKCGSKVGEKAESKPTEEEKKPEPAAQEETITCSCGNQLKPGAKFCPKCGSKVGEKAEGTPAAEEKKPESSAQEETITCSCGNQLKPGAKFCPKCGNPVGGAAAPAIVSANSNTAPIPAVAANGVAAPAAAVKKPLDKKVVAIIGAAAAVLIVIIVIIVIIANATPKIRLADYVKVEYNGYNGYGTVSAEFDSDKFRSDWEGKLKYTSGTPGEIKSVLEFYEDPTEMVLYNVKYDYSFDKSSELKNGDKIKLKWSIGSDKSYIEKFVKVELDDSETEFTVSELQEIGSFDPFDGFTVKYTGFNGNGKPDYTAKYSLSYNFDQEEGLKNGDTVHVTVSAPYGDDLAKYCANNIGSVPSTTGKDFKVEGLSEMESFDPFEGVEVVFEGVSPEGKAEIENNSNKNLRYELDKTEGLKDGDKVTVTVTAPYGEDLDKYCADEYQAKPNASTKEYTVSGLGTYLSKLEDIDEDTLATLKSESEDTIKSNITDSGETLDKVEYQGMILLNLKDGKESRDPWSASGDHDHMLHVVYKVTVTCENYDKKKIPFTFWTTCRFNDIKKLEDGTCKVDTSEVIIPDEYISVPDSSFSYQGFDGYANLFAKLVTAKISDYTYETDVNKTQPGSGSETSKQESSEASKQESSEASAEESAEASKQETSAESSEESKQETSAEGSEAGKQESSKQESSAEESSKKAA